MYHKWIKEYGKSGLFLTAYNGVTGVPFKEIESEDKLSHEDYLQILEEFRRVILNQMEVDIEKWNMGVMMIGMTDLIPRYIEIDNAVILEFQIILNNFLVFLQDKEYLENIFDLQKTVFQFMPLCLNNNLDINYWSQIKRKNIEAYMKYMDEQMETINDLLDDLEGNMMKEEFFPPVKNQKHSNNVIPMIPKNKIPLRVSNEEFDNKIYQLRIDIVGAKPPIWRRILVPAKMTFGDLHEIIQTAFDWDTAHLYQFNVDNVVLSDFEAEDLIGDKPHVYYTSQIKKDMAKVKLNQLVSEGDKFEYIYDFGDSWEHKIVVEEVLEHDPAIPFYPYCTKGKRTAPFEDFGGIERFDDFVADFKKNANRKSVQDVLEWAMGVESERFYPDYVDIEEINELLGLMW
ncbi:plasmid pRiA4b ORF-3 family protein [Vagococcus hydrophili]|uniref:Plasmid pRiA4b ORF-3 family protein n=1 Tax=Vagococcus hydrophili TaxID=2714947 RepID=A0A6G8AVF1_9ENTE|nr:plasmid pRiA4b ORF-3 family protein [Vagococcus hydrophili]QIL48932.1 plasmid pRiA4b ORF-3 family protein [Vagococcus hydrophili]